MIIVCSERREKLASQRGKCVRAASEGCPNVEQDPTVEPVPRSVEHSTERQAVLWGWHDSPIGVAGIIYGDGWTGRYHRLR